MSLPALSPTPACESCQRRPGATIKAFGPLSTDSFVVCTECAMRPSPVSDEQRAPGLTLAGWYAAGGAL